MIQNTFANPIENPIETAHLQMQARQHLDRLLNRTIQKMGRGDLVRWIEQNTYINSRRYSTKDHEYQARIMSDLSPEIVVRKCSQVGLSEASIRMSLALVAVLEHYNVIYTFPSATFAAKYVKTRVDPVISTSPYLRAATTGGEAVDSSEVKKIGDNFLYFNGAAASNAAISVAADCLIHDEVDFSDQVILSQYTSRLTHSPHKHKIKLSTPTVPGGPIDADFQDSRRYWNMCKCEHCGHSFVPDYYEHVKIPGWDHSLKDITKTNFHRVNVAQARLLCPHCGKAPSLHIEHREWVCENPRENHVAAGYQVQPFDAPALITIPSLIKTSVDYVRRADFDNFSLGLPAEDDMSGLTEQDLEAIGVQGEVGNFVSTVIGADMGVLCHIIVAGIAPQGELVVLHMEAIPLSRFKERFNEIKQQYRATVKVLDTMPYVETVLKLQETDDGVYGGVFSVQKTLDIYDVRVREGDYEEGVMSLRQVNINKHKALDMLLEDLRTDKVVVKKTVEWDNFKTQMMSMRRALLQQRDGETLSNWVKSKKGNDHYHHALLYTWLAAKLRGLGTSSRLATPPGMWRKKLRT